MLMVSENRIFGWQNELSITEFIAELANKQDHRILALWATDCAAARAAGHTAATVHVAGHAVHAATYAAKAVAYAADPIDAEAATSKEHNWQFKHLLELANTHTEEQHNAPASCFFSKTHRNPRGNEQVQDKDNE